MNIIAGTILLFTAATLLAADIPPTYSFKSGSTNIYMLAMESSSEAGTERMSGPVLLICRTNTGAAMHLSLRSFLTNSSAANTRFMNPFGRVTPLFDALDNGTMVASEFVIGPTGRLLRTPRTPALPTPAGPLISLLFEDTSIGLAEVVAPSSLFDPLGGDQDEGRTDVDMGFAFGRGRGPQGPFYYGKTAFSPLKAALSGGTNRLSRVTKTVTDLKVGPLPRVGIEAEHTTSILKSEGLLLNRESTFRIQSATEAVIRKAVFKVSATLLDATNATSAIVELAARYPNAALFRGTSMSPPLPKPEPVTAAEMKQLLADAESAGSPEFYKLLTRISNGSFEENSRVLVSDAIAALPTAYATKRDAMHKFISTMATKDHADLLAQVIQKGPAASRKQAAFVLARLRDMRAIEPLFEMVASGAGYSDSSGAKDLLAQMGAMAEPAAIRLLSERHLETKRNGCDILAKIGTTKCVEPLKILVGSTDSQVASQAGSALRQVMDRSAP